MTTDDGASISAVTRDGTAITDNDVTDGITVPPLLAVDHGIVVAVTEENGGEAPGSYSSSIQAQSFTTGSNADGYTLSEVAVRHVFSLSKDGTMVKVMSDNGSGRPGDLVADLDNPSSFTNNSILSFTAPASTETLERASTPAAVVGMTTSITANRTLSKSSISERRAP